jgi:hypothetical protein
VIALGFFQGRRPRKLLPGILPTMPNRRYPLPYVCGRHRRRLRANEIFQFIEDANAGAQDNHGPEVADDEQGMVLRADGEGNRTNLMEDEPEEVVEDVEGSHSESDSEEDDEMQGNENFLEGLAKWASEGVSIRKANEILHLLKGHQCFRDIPSDTRTLLKTPRRVPLREIQGGVYGHIGIKYNLYILFGRYPEILQSGIIRLQCSIDGLPLAKSCGSQIWPISMGLEDHPSIPPFTVGIFHGNEKPQSCAEFLHDFVEEMKQLKAEGIEHNGVTCEVVVTCYVCDAPARAFAAQIKSHTGYFGCGKCCVQGEYVSNRVIFDEINALRRTDEGFSSRADDDHHIGNSPLEDIPGTRMVTDFPFEYMHLVCLGVMRKILLAWLKGNLNVRLQARKVEMMNERTMGISNHIPCEFARKPRLVRDILRWKATEFRTFLVYTGPFLLKDILSKSGYKHFLTFHYAIRVLLAQHYRQHLDYAKTLLQYFVRKFEQIYGRESLSYNVHGLLHLVEDSVVHGPLDHYSSFRFEDHLYQIKRLIRKPNLPLPQIMKRLHERSFFHYGVKESGKTRECRADLRALPLGLQAPFFSHYKYNSFNISTKNPNNCVISKCGKVIVVECIGTRNGEVFIMGWAFESLLPFYATPTSSINVGIYTASNVGHNQLWAMSDIQRKALKLASQTNADVYYIAELLNH